jgi:hypothetical protein
MYPAMCFDTSMLVGFLVFVLIACAVVGAAFVLVVSTFVKWLHARRERPAAE